MRHQLLLHVFHLNQPPFIASNVAKTYFQLSWLARSFYAIASNTKCVAPMVLLEEPSRPNHSIPRHDPIPIVMTPGWRWCSSMAWAFSSPKIRRCREKVSLEIFCYGFINRSTLTISAFIWVTTQKRPTNKTHITLTIPSLEFQFPTNTRQHQDSNTEVTPHTQVTPSQASLTQKINERLIWCR